MIHLKSCSLVLNDGNLGTINNLHFNLLTHILMKVSNKVNLHVCNTTAF